MSGTRTLPVENAVGRILSGLVNRAVTVKKVAPVVPSAKTPSVVALFAQDDGSLAAAWVADLAFAAAAGAALTVIPPNVAQDCVRRSTLDPGVSENYAEVMNVAAAVINGAGGAHVKLVGVHPTPGQPLPNAAAALLLKPAGRVDFEIDIAGYGTGRCSILV